MLPTEKVNFWEVCFIGSVPSQVSEYTLRDKSV